MKEFDMSTDGIFWPWLGSCSNDDAVESISEPDIAHDMYFVNKISFQPYASGAFGTDNKETVVNGRLTYWCLMPARPTGDRLYLNNSSSSWKEPGDAGKNTLPPGDYAGEGRTMMHGLRIAMQFCRRSGAYNSFRYGDECIIGRTSKIQRRIICPG